MTAEARVSAAVAAVLARLPPDVQRLLDGRWGWRLVGDLGKHDDGRIILGEAWYRDGLVLVSGVAVQRLQEDVDLQCVIAHELGHLSLHFRGSQDKHDEAKVNEVVRRWGWDMDRLL